VPEHAEREGSSPPDDDNRLVIASRPVSPVTQEVAGPVEPPNAPVAEVPEHVEPMDVSEHIPAELTAVQSIPAPDADVERGGVARDVQT